ERSSRRPNQVCRPWPGSRAAYVSAWNACQRLNAFEGMLKWRMRILSGALRLALIICSVFALVSFSVLADSDPSHRQACFETPQPWPGGIIPYDISKLTPAQRTNALKAMQLWLDTGANIRFVSRTTEAEYVNFTGATNAGNNTSCVGFKKGTRADIN